MRTSPFRSAGYSLRCKTENFKAILFPRRSCRRCLHMVDRRTPVLEAAAVHPKCAKSSSGSHARPCPAKADTPRCLAISMSYCRRPRPPHLALRGVIGGGTTIVSVEQDDI
jgi:hypothetical protein